jgi:hypothetical protein
VEEERGEGDKMKTCRLCGKSGHNRRNCKEPTTSLPEIKLPQKVNHSDTNSYKSNNGNALEDKFIRETGIKKATKDMKPTFINEHGNKQEIDFDFVYTINNQQVFLDCTTSYRSDRVKQKGYNALMLRKEYEKQGLPKPKFIIGIGNLVENGKIKKTCLIEGIDEIKTIEEVIKEVLDSINQRG